MKNHVGQESVVVGFIWYSLNGSVGQANRPLANLFAGFHVLLTALLVAIVVVDSVVHANWSINRCWSGFDRNQNRSWIVENRRRSGLNVGRSCNRLDRNENGCGRSWIVVNKHRSGLNRSQIGWSSSAILLHYNVGQESIVVGLVCYGLQGSIGKANSPIADLFAWLHVLETGLLVAHVVIDYVVKAGGLRLWVT